MSIKFIQLPPAPIVAFLNSSDVSFDVAGFLLNDGTTAVATTDIGDICYATIEPRTERAELISFTIDSVTAAGVATITAVRGLSQISPYGTGGATFEHQAGSNLVISNNPGLFNKLTAKANDEAITGDWTVPTPANPNSIPNKTYVDTKVSKTGAETIAEVKTFTSSPIVPDATADDEAASKGQTETYADTKVSKTGAEAITGIKTFSLSPVIPDATEANQPFTKGQHDADAAASSAVASPTVRGTAKIDVAADTPSDPEALTATADRVAAILGGGDFGTPSATNKFITEDFRDVNRTIDEILTSFQPINGSSLPVPVIIDDDGTLLIADANVTGADDFHGFVETDASAQTPAVFLNSTTPGTTATTISHTVNAGTDRIVIVTVCVTASGDVFAPTGVTWDSNAMTQLLTDHDRNAGVSVWYYVAGDSGSNQTGDVVITTGGSTPSATFMDNYEYVNQSTPFIDSDTTRAISGKDIVTNITATEAYFLTIQIHCDKKASSITMDSSLSTRHTVNTSRVLSDGYLKVSSAKVLTSSTTGSDYVVSTDEGVGASLILKNSTITGNITLIVGGILSGFTGLTPGADYYVQDTAGTIGTSPGSTSLRCCRALSATTVVITQI